MTDLNHTVQKLAWGCLPRSYYALTNDPWFLEPAQIDELNYQIFDQRMSKLGYTWSPIFSSISADVFISPLTWDEIFKQAMEQPDGSFFGLISFKKPKSLNEVLHTVAFQIHMNRVQISDTNKLGLEHYTVGDPAREDAFETTFYYMRAFEVMNYFFTSEIQPQNIFEVKPGHIPPEVLEKEKFKRAELGL